MVKFPVREMSAMDAPTYTSNVPSATTYESASTRVEG